MYPDVDAPLYWTDEYVNQLAERKGCTVERADDCTLQIDLDSDEAFAFFEEQIGLMNNIGLVSWNGYDVRPSKSGLPHRHVTVKLLESLSIIQRIALQAALGSDRRRELLSIKGLMNDTMLYPVVLFRPKGEA